MGFWTKWGRYRDSLVSRRVSAGLPLEGSCHCWEVVKGNKKEAIQQRNMSSKTADDLATEAAMDALMREAWVLLGLGFLVTGLRTFARVRAVGWKGLQLDDYLAWMGSVCYLLPWLPPSEH